MNKIFALTDKNGRPYVSSFQDGQTYRDMNEKKYSKNDILKYIELFE